MAPVLDLSKIDELNLKDPQDQMILVRMVDEVYDASQSYLDKLSRIWDENIRFYEGDQHIFWNKITRRFEVIPITKYNDFLPRPVTNVILPVVQTITSILTRNKPSASVWPNSTDYLDVDAAKLSEKIVDTRWEIDEEQVKVGMSAKVLLLCGTVFRKDYWDSSLGPLSPVTGKPVGDSAVEVIDPFRMITDLQSNSWYIESSVKPLTWIRQQYGRKGDGYTGNVDKVMEDQELSPQMEILTRLKTSTGVGTAPGSSYQGGTQGRNILKGCAVTKECYIEPTPKHPKGMMVVIADRKLLYAGDSTYYDDRYVESWHPYTACKWEEMYFRFHGMSLVENLVPLQRRLNAIDALIILNRMKNVSPQWLIPKGCGVPEGYINGAPGLNIIFNPAGANGAKPEPIMGRGLPVDVYKERELILQAIHSIAGDNEVLQGIRPEGVNTAAGLQMLLEQAHSKFNTFIQQWEKFIERGQCKKLRLIASKYREVRPDLVAKMKAMNKDNLDVEIKAFIGSDLNDNVDVRIESGSSLPRSKLAENEQYKDAAKMGLLGPLDPQQNPVGNAEFLERIGLTPVTTEINADVERARWINAVLTAINRGEMTEDQYPPILPFDNLDLNVKILTDRMKSPSFKDEKGLFKRRLDELQQIAGNVKQIQMIKMQEQAMQMSAQQPMPQMPQGLQGPAPIPPPGAMGMGPQPVGGPAMPPSPMQQ